MPKAKAKQATKTKSTTKSRTVKSANQYDTPRNLVFGGLIGLLLAYVIVSRALNTGSYWEYFFGLVILIITIRLFIRSLKLK